MTTELDSIRAEIKEVGLRQVVKNVIMRELIAAKPDSFWHGYGELQDALLALGLTHRLRHEVPMYASTMKKLLQELKAEGKVCTRPIFREDGKLNGMGWFAL